MANIETVVIVIVCFPYLSLLAQLVTILLYGHIVAVGIIDGGNRRKPPTKLDHILKLNRYGHDKVYKPDKETNKNVSFYMANIETVVIVIVC
jgi:hypothetical protein